jgi:hypothetical protein
LVAEFCVAEFAAAVGLPTETGKAYLGEALELRHRLPQTWARVRAGELPAWRARRIARATIASHPRRRGSWTTRSRGSRTGSAPAGWTGWSRRPSSGSCPEEARRRREAAADGRHAHVHTHQVSFEGTVWVEAEVDLADALDLDTALSAGAARLADLGSPPRWTCAAPKRSARWPATSSSLDLDTTTPRRRARLRRDGEVVLHVHISEDAISAPDTRLHLARVGNTRSFVDADQVRDWCGAPACR